MKRLVLAGLLLATAATAFGSGRYTSWVGASADQLKRETSRLAERVGAYSDAGLQPFAGPRSRRACSRTRSMRARGCWSRWFAIAGPWSSYVKSALKSRPSRAARRQAPRKCHCGGRSRARASDLNRDLGGAGGPLEVRPTGPSSAASPGAAWWTTACNWLSAGSRSKCGRFRAPRTRTGVVHLHDRACRTATSRWTSRRSAAGARSGSFNSRPASNDFTAVVEIVGRRVRGERIPAGHLLAVAVDASPSGPNAFARSIRRCRAGGDRWARHARRRAWQPVGPVRIRRRNRRAGCARFRGAGRRTGRPAGAERRRQDHDHRHPDHADPADGRPRGGRRRGRRGRSGRRAPAHRRGAAATQSRPIADGAREPAVPRRVFRHRRGPVVERRARELLQNVRVGRAARTPSRISCRAASSSG